MWCCAVLCCAVLCCAVLCRAVLWWRGGGGSSCAVSGPFWPDTHPVQPAGPQRGPCLGLPHRLAELLAGGLPVTPRVTATPKPCPTWAELAGVAREGTRALCCVVLCCVVLCCVVLCCVALRCVVLCCVFLCALPCPTLSLPRTKTHLTCILKQGRCHRVLPTGRTYETGAA